MTLKTLFQKRSAQHTKDLMRYGRLIFNDHFVLLLFLLFGAGGYAYSQFLETISMGDIQPRLLLLVLFLFVTSTGSVTLYLEPADQIFLMPKEQAFKNIFKRLIGQSYLTSLISVAVVAFITFPILTTTVGAQTLDLLFIFLALAGVKWMNTLLKLYPFFHDDSEKEQRNQMMFLLGKLVVIGSLLFVDIKITAILTGLAAAFLAYQFFTEKLYFHNLFRWDTMIQAEEKRMQRVYRFIGMFTNVPNIQTNIKRLSWLDGLLDRLSKRNPTASYYYVLRLAARNTEYSMLVIRATLVGALLLAVTESIIISGVLLVLFLYIIGFQLLTLVSEIQRVPLFQIYPITDEEKEEAVYRLVFQILVVVSVVLALASLLGVGVIGFGFILIGLLFAYGFSYFYAQRRLRTVN